MSQRSKSKATGGCDWQGRSGPAAGEGADADRPAVQAHTRWLSIAVCLLLAVAVWAVFGQTRHYEFVNYDDDIYVYDNPAITQGISLHGIGWLFTHPDGPDEWLPVTALSRMLDWQFYGPNAGGHHLTNVLLHAATAILLFLVLQEMTGAIWRSAFVAAVFAIHPLRVESVAWVTERKDVLSGLFFMLTLLCYVRAVRGRSAAIETGPAPTPSRFTFPPTSDVGVHASRYYWLAVVFFALGLMAKTMLVTVPFVLLLLDYWPLGRIAEWGMRSGELSGNAGGRMKNAEGGSFSSQLPDAAKRSGNGPGASKRGEDSSTLKLLILEKIPFFLLSVAACVATIVAQKHLLVVVHGLSLSWSWRAGTALMAYADYLGHLLYPVGLALIYPHPVGPLPLGRIGWSALLLCVISVGVVAGRRRHPYLLVGWLWYLVTLLPVIDVSQEVDSARADRYTYLPQIGLCLMVAWAAVVLGGNWRWWRVALGWAAGVIFAGLMAAAYVQTGYWRNSVTLWSRTLARTPQSSIARCNYGIALAGQGKLEDATRQFDRALELNPEDVKTLNNLGKVLTTERKFDEATQYFNRALQLNPGEAKALNNLGVALAAEGKLDDAVQQYQRALEQEPEFAEARYNLGNARTAQGRLEEAAQEYERALQINPDYAEAHCNLGLVLAREGKLDQAVQQYRRAIELKPDYAEALNNLSAALSAQGQAGKAVQYSEQALQANPDNADALNNSGVALARQGRLDEAIQHFRRALQLNPDDASTHNNLGIALASQGKVSEAIPEFQQALNLATAHGSTALVESIRQRLRLYQPVSPALQTP